MARKGGKELARIKKCKNDIQAEFAELKEFCEITVGGMESMERSVDNALKRLKRRR